MKDGLHTAAVYKQVHTGSVNSKHTGMFKVPNATNTKSGTDCSVTALQNYINKGQHVLQHVKQLNVTTALR